MTAFEQAHAESIADEAPSLRVLPAHRRTRILIGGSVRKPVPILDAHLKTLAWQELPPNLDVSYAFVPDWENPQDEAVGCLQEWVTERGGVLLQGSGVVAGDYRDQGDVTHRWTATAMARLAKNKNAILRYAVQHQFDAVWLVDSDLLMDPYTLRSLVEARRPIVAAVYWTRWTATERMHAAPQVWLRHVYEPFQSGGIARGQTEQEFRATLVSRRLTQVWGLGACTLVQREVIEKGVGFHRFPALPTGGLWDGEDRHFCSWAEHLHVPMYADPWPDIFHVYHDADVARIPEMLQRFEAGRGLRPELGEWVSLRLLALEEPALREETVRVRLGSGRLVPPIEAAVLAMGRGEERILRIPFPADYPLEHYRNRTKLLHVTLVDHKPFGVPPVLEDEMYVAGNQLVDMTTLTADQHQIVQEDA